MTHYPFPDSRGTKIAFAAFFTAMLFLARDSMFTTAVIGFEKAQFLMLGVICLLGAAFLIVNRRNLLKILKDANAKATFFVTGEFCDKYPDDVKKFYDAGHSVQNHSDAHPHVKGMNINDLIADTKECSRKIKMITGEEPKLYRAPYGEYDDTVMATVEGMGFKVIQWDVDSIDWEDPDAATIQNRILSKTQSGSILLFHNDLENTTQALPATLTSLLQKGYEFVKADDLIYYDSYRMDNTGRQIYEPNLTATSNVVIYADDSYANSAFEKIRRNLSIEEIYTLSTYDKLAVIEKIKGFLTDAEIAAIQMMSYEDLYAAYGSLVFAAENYGTGGAAEVEQPLDDYSAYTQQDYTTEQEEYPEMSEAEMTEEVAK